jgi:cardiolipin synthase
MRTRHVLTLRLIMILALLSTIQFGNTVSCQAGEGADGTEGPIRMAKFNVPEAVVLPEYREIPLREMEKHIERSSKQDGGPGKTHALGHLAVSHLGIITRPVSGVHKLLAWVVYTGQDSARNVLLLEEEVIPSPRLNTGPGMDLDRWERQLDEITGTKLTSGRIKLLIDGEEFFTRLTDSFLEAEESIHMRIYIYDNDDYATQLADLLRERSSDVDVRVLVDGLGTIMANGVHPDTLPADHRPALSMKEYLTKGSKVRMRLHKNLWLTLDHTKTIMVDRKTAFIGGMNIGREYRYDWHDLMMEVDGPVVNTLQDEFNKAWAYAGILGDLGKAFTRRGSNGAKANDGDYPIRVLFTRTSDSQIYRAHMAAIKNARRYIFIQNPYIADDAILHELIKARKRGVDVRVVIPENGNWKTMDRSNKLVTNAMMAHGIKVYLYPVMSHVKAAVIDGWACVGSANLDKASFRTNQETNLATSEPEVVKELLERLFYPDFERSRPMTETNIVNWSDHIYEILADNQ